jgi:glycosyltransferase involved in cell wall biosynthesis
MADSIHVARWISQLEGTGWDIHVFDARESSVVNPDLRGVTVYTCAHPPKLDANNKASYDWPFIHGHYFLRTKSPWLSRMLIPPRVTTLEHVISKLKPDIIHSLEMQHESYPLLDVKQKLGTGFSIPWIYSSWGADMFFYKKDPKHIDRIRGVLEACDYYISDCQRDVTLARKLGFRGEVLGVFPGPGGFDIQHMLKMRDKYPTSQRKVIAVKGYDHWYGRALMALEGLRRCADILSSYDIQIYLATKNVQLAAEQLSRTADLRITILPESPHEEILKLMSRSRVAIGVNISDGTPNTMLEAMVMGAFPIQSDTISTAEWIEDGKNGFLVPPEDLDAISRAIRRALTEDKLVDRAAEINDRLVAERIDRTVIQPQVVAMYKRVYEQSKLAAMARNK